MIRSQGGVRETILFRKLFRYHVKWIDYNKVQDENIKINMKQEKKNINSSVYRLQIIYRSQSRKHFIKRQLHLKTIQHFLLDDLCNTCHNDFLYNSDFNFKKFLSIELLGVIHLILIKPIYKFNPCFLFEMILFNFHGKEINVLAGVHAN